MKTMDMDPVAAGGISRNQPFAQLFALHELVTEMTIVSACDFALQIRDAVAQQPLQCRRLFRCEIHLHDGLQSNYRAA